MGPSRSSSTGTRGGWLNAGIASGAPPKACRTRRDINTSTIIGMPRVRLTDEDRRRGIALGAAIQSWRGAESASSLALRAGVSVDTLRKIEQGGIPSPGFFLVARLADAIGVDLSVFAALAVGPVNGEDGA